ncbi:unnamed protein product [Lampetra fluviatilis]
MAADDRSRADSAKQKRAAQLKRWAGSETDLETAVLRRKKSKVKFDDGAVFLAACSSGDTDEVLSLIERGADINYANVDGLSALHQACIDENFDMVKFLVERDANINQADNEGWTPLHAAASCGYIDIAKYLIAHGANVAAVNSESELPLDITEDEALEDMLQEELSKHGVDQDAARKEEEQVMMRDARQWLNSGRIDEVRHPKSGGTALHVAAAKGYIDVIKLLLQAGFDVNVRDNDGWTPLHAAAHWGKDEACRVLVENFCNMEALNKVGQTAFDVSDEDVLSYLEELQTKQKTVLNEQREGPYTAPLLSAVASRKEGDGESKHDETSSSSSEEEDDEDEEEDQEGSEAESQPENHTGTVARSRRLCQTSSPMQLSFPRAGAGGIAAGAAAPKEEEKKTVDVAPPASAPASWRSGLRKTGSHGALPEAAAAAAGATGAGEPPRDALRERGDVTQAGSGIARSASSPRLTTTETRERERVSVDNKFTFPRKPGTADPEEKENRDTVGMLLARSSSYTRRRFDDSSENTAPAYQRSSPNGRHGGEVSSSDSSSGLSPSSPPPVLSTSTSTTPVPTVRVSDDVMNVTSTAPVSAVAPSVGSSSAIFRSRVEEAPERGSREGIGGGSGGTVPAVTVTVPPTVSGGSAPSLESGAALSGENRERRRSYLTPVRDEESESQRKARSRQARQTRRSTQGVTLTDLQEAEKIRRYGSDKRGGREQPEEKESAERLDDKKDTESREASDARGRPSRTYGSDTQDGAYQRLRPSASLAPAGVGSPVGRAGGGGSTGSGLGGIGSTRVPTVTVVEPERGDSGEEDSQTEGDKGKNKLSVVRDRRRPREKRRSTGVSFMSPDSDENDHDLSDEEEEESEEVEKEVKELYEQMRKENEEMRKKLRDAQLQLAETKVQLERVTQRQERFADKTSLLEAEKREKRALERKVSEMEEEMKGLGDLRADNQRLKDENAALIRVISKLSK